MAQLPTPGADDGVWGQILNDFLLASHNQDGTLKNGVVGASQIANQSISEEKLDGSLRTKINNPSSAEQANWGGIIGNIDDQTDLVSILNTKQPAGSYVNEDDLSGALALKADSIELDAKANVVDVESALAEKANASDVMEVSSNEAVTGVKNFVNGAQINGQAVVATNDARLTNTRTPSSNSVSTASLQDLAVTAPKLSAGPATTGQVLSYNGTNLAWTTVTPDGAIPDSSTSQKGIIQLAGDLSGTAGAPTVAKVNGVSVSGTPSAGQVIVASSASAAAWQTAPSGSAVTADSITDATTVGKSVLRASDAQDARTAIGAGTSNLVIGTTASTAKAGNYTPNADNVTESTTRKFLTTTERTKLSGIATGATVNATDAALRARSSHTGTQSASTISDLTETTQDTVAAFIKAGTNISLAHDDANNTLTISSTGGSGQGEKGDPGDLTPTVGVTTAPSSWSGSISASGITFPATYHRILAGNTTITALPTPSAEISGTITFVLRLPTTAPSSGYTLNWPSSVYKDSGQDLAMTKTAGYHTIFHLFWTGNKWTLSKQGDYNLSGV